MKPKKGNRDELAVAPRETIIKYGFIEVFSILFFSCLFTKSHSVSLFFCDAGAAIHAAYRGGIVYSDLCPEPELFGFGALRFLITKRGVVYQKRRLRYRLAWEDIQHVILTPDLYGRVSKNCYIVFYADEDPRLVSGRSEFHPRAFGSQYRKGLPEIIKKYCDLPIERLDTIERKKK